MRTATIVLAALFLAVPLVGAADLPTWSLVRSPNTDPEEPNHLNAAACPAVDDCWAVGYASTCTDAEVPVALPVNGLGVCNIHRTLIQRWDGSEWTLAASPNPAVKANMLDDVTCLAPDDCWAVGAYGDPPGPRPLVLHWDGASWALTLAPSPAAPVPDGSLVSIACPAPDDCWAVGSASNYITSDTIPRANALILRWDGVVWSLVTEPLLANLASDTSTRLTHVACANALDCWIAGTRETPDETETILMRFDGSAWSVVDDPLDDPLHDRFTDLACPAVDACWATVQRLVGTSSLPALGRFDGVAWTVTTVTALPASSALYGVTCLATDDCWVVGADTDPPLLHWDGVAWTRVASPRIGDAVTVNFYDDVACADAAHCFAVGEYFAKRTLVMGTLEASS